jgi:hypothetical protein
MQKQGRVLVLLTVPFLLLSPVLTNAQLSVPAARIGQTPFLNLANTTWKLYNETSASTSIMKLNTDGKYIRSLHGNNLTGLWNSNIVLQQQVQLCPTEQKSTSACVLVGLVTKGPDLVGFLDGHGNRMHLQR